MAAFLENDISQNWIHIIAPSQRWQVWQSFYFPGMLTENDGINAYIKILTYYKGLQSGQMTPQAGLFGPGVWGYLADLLFWCRGGEIGVLRMREHPLNIPKHAPSHCQKHPLKMKGKLKGTNPP